LITATSSIPAKAQYLSEIDSTESLDEREKVVLLHVAQPEAMQSRAVGAMI
jgi:hypothetical protein